MGLAQPSTDYDVDSNPEGWTERLWVKGLCKPWVSARLMRCRQPCALAACVDGVKAPNDMYPIIVSSSVFGSMKRCMSLKKNVLILVVQFYCDGF